MAEPQHDAWLRKLGVNIPPRQGAAAGAATPAAAADPRASELRRTIAMALGRAEAALDQYRGQKKLNDEQWVISGLSRAAKAVTSLGKFKDPGDELSAAVAEVKDSAARATAAVAAGDFATAGQIAAQIDARSKQADKLARGYTDGLIDGAESAKTATKAVDTGAKVVGAVALTVATGGAAGGVAAAEIATATGISVAGGMAASTAGALTKVALGDKVDWGLFSIDILMQGLLARFGGQLTEGIAGAVAKRLGPELARTIGGTVIKNVAAQAVMHVDTTLFKTALETAYKKLAGQNVAYQKVYDECVAALTDPSSLVVAAASAAAQSHVEVATSRANPFKDLSDKEIDAAVSKLDPAPDTGKVAAEVPRVTGGKSNPRIAGKRVPDERAPRPDLEDIPRRAGESQRDALARVRTVIGKKISDHPPLEKLWNDARAEVLKKNTLTDQNYEQLYDLTRAGFWRRVRSDASALKILSDAGLATGGGKSSAAKLDGVSVGRDAETIVSLDHIAEKAQGNNWQKALDANNLQFEFAAPNTEREIKQMRHPELR